MEGRYSKAHSKTVGIGSLDMFNVAVCIFSVLRNDMALVNIITNIIRNSYRYNADSPWKELQIGARLGLDL
jgi:hypothetical protein